MRASAGPSAPLANPCTAPPAADFPPSAAPQPLLGLLGGHAAQICIRALHLARLPLGHLLGHVVGTHALHAVGRADGRADMLKKAKQRLSSLLIRQLLGHDADAHALLLSC